MNTTETCTLRDAVLAEIGPLTGAEDYDIDAIVSELQRLGVTAKHMELLTADVDGQLAIAAENLNVLVWQIATEHERLAPAS
ncbi:Uncharacterised protein [Mycobacteroides abscessus subsp. abscessus]|uniref:hypothetical protein n=1 Tax=Mycobacteroides abscessus TaxID=36809 RepID=UPI000927877E|nr:hypothetical protein [Mycobacteroides abscessus]MBE5513721.1 hypothetical protein [Mycobacteroides abscessus]SIM29020.1 Uncharacterised protein [Mycobacteroides abscessus subsp. abscessus]SLC90916.1 Uncharacterised protein [Mycobacteroides abscessus subsp. massiliense]SLE31695.1 Uncharacterised protein [Mycobacteroides abscessus subsp. massiliense]SLE58875.1 Uncharacterised protein [Mycobacteroides abscessus subsp. massiliense]